MRTKSEVIGRGGLISSLVALVTPLVWVMYGDSLTYVTRMAEVSSVQI